MSKAKHSNLFERGMPMTRTVSIGVLIALAVLLLGGGLWLNGAINRHADEMTRHQADLQAELRGVRSEIDSVNAETAFVGTKAWIEQQAREQGFVKEGEMMFQFTNEDALDDYSEAELAIYAEEMQQ